MKMEINYQYHSCRDFKDCRKYLFIDIKIILLGRVGVVKEMGSYQFIGGSRGNLIIIRRI